MLREDFMPDYGLTASTLASALGVSRQTIHELLREERSITPLMALRLSRPFGNSAAFWLNAQQASSLGIRAGLSRRIGADSTASCIRLIPDAMGEILRYDSIVINPRELQKTDRELR
jgi:addiction module HigA family antidote